MFDRWYRGAFAALAAALLALPAWAQEDGVSVWDGVFTEEQAQRGQSVFNSVCARCHGLRGNGAGDPEMPAGPAVARGTFLQKWEGQSVAALFEYVRGTMPTDNPRSMSDQEYIDAIVRMFVLSNMPAGEAELAPDAAALEEIVIEGKAE